MRLSLAKHLSRIGIINKTMRSRKELKKETFINLMKLISCMICGLPAGWSASSRAAIQSLPEVEGLDEAISLCFDGLCCDGGHHKQWYLEEIAKTLCGDKYNSRRAEAMTGEDGPDTYYFEGGIVP